MSSIKAKIATISVILTIALGMNAIPQTAFATMVPNFPDSLNINGDGFFVIHAGVRSDVVVYRHIVNGNDSSAHQIIFNANGSYNSCIGLGCGASGQSISQLVSQGFTFEMVNEEQNLQPLLDRLDLLETQVVTLQSQVTTLDSEVTSLNSEVTSLNSEVTSLNSEVTTLTTEVTTIDAKVNQNTSDILEIRQVFENIKNAIQNFLNGS